MAEQKRIQVDEETRGPADLLQEFGSGKVVKEERRNFSLDGERGAYKGKFVGAAGD
jgi:hypothetical protein